MAEVFFISDTHFGDRDISPSPRRPFASIEEHDEEIVRCWNSVVSDNDMVWHLGDFALGDIQQLAIAARLKGRKQLVLGNNDLFPTADYARYFEQLFGMVRFDERLLLSHMPVHPIQLYQCKVNVHGHMHKGYVGENQEEDKRYFNVSCERVNYTPIALDELLKRAGE